MIKVSITQKKSHGERGTNHWAGAGRAKGASQGGWRAVSRGISNVVINRKSKRVKRAGREIKSDGRAACIVHGCISAP